MPLFRLTLWIISVFREKLYFDYIYYYDYHSEVVEDKRVITFAYRREVMGGIFDATQRDYISPELELDMEDNLIFRKLETGPPLFNNRPTLRTHWKTVCIGNTIVRKLDFYNTLALMVFMADVKRERAQPQPVQMQSKGN